MIDEKWWSEFTGFFYGEGSVEIQQYRRPRSLGYPDWVGFRPRLRISQRADDLPMLQDVQAKLGGTISAFKSPPIIRHADGKVYTSHAAHMWELVGVGHVAPIVAKLLEGTLVHRKKIALGFVAEYMALTEGPGKKHSPELKARIIELKEQLRESRQFSS